MKILVAYATKSGLTRDVAAWIADECSHSGHEAVLVNLADEPSPVGCDGVVVGSGIRAGRWHGVGLRWLAAHREVLVAVPFATFTSSLEPSIGTDEALARVSGYTAAVLEPLGLRAVAHASFPGAYEPAKFGFAERLIMKAMRRDKTGDYRDEALTRAWAREVIEAFHSAGAGR